MFIIPLSLETCFGKIRYGSYQLKVNVVNLRANKKKIFCL